MIEHALGITYTTELSLVLGTLFFNPSATDEDREFSRVVMKYSTDFDKRFNKNSIFLERYIFMWKISFKLWQK